MKKLLGFLILILLLAALVYAGATMYVCKKGELNLKFNDTEYNCSCVREDDFSHMDCEKLASEESEESEEEPEL